MDTKLGISSFVTLFILCLGHSVPLLIDYSGETCSGCAGFSIVSG